MNSINKSKYYLHFINAYFKYNWIYLLQPKYQNLSCFINFKIIIENQLELKIKSLQTEDGKKYTVFFKPLTDVKLFLPS